MAEILVVDDDAPLAAVVRDVLASAGHDVSIAVGGAEAIRAIRRRAPDLLLLDMEMPGLDGREVLRELKRDGDVPMPVVMFTANDDSESVEALRAGAVDFVRKGVDSAVLVARIGRALRRDRGQIITAGRMRIDLRSQRAWVDDRELELQNLLFRFLAYLASRSGALATRDELVREVWGADWDGYDHSIEQTVHLVRRELREPGWIQTVRGRGYRLVPLA